MFEGIRDFFDRFFFKLQRKLWQFNLAMLFMVILPMAVLAVFGIRNAYRNATLFALAENKSEAFLLANILKERLDMLVQFGQSISQRTNLLEGLLQDDWDEAIRAVRFIPRDFEYVDRVLLVDKQGIIKSQVPITPNYVGLNRADAEWYQGVSRALKPYVSEVYRDPILPERNIIAIAIPIKKELLSEEDTKMTSSQDLKAILLMHVPVQVFSDLAREETGVDPGEFNYIVDHKGNLVFHPKIETLTNIINYRIAPAVQKILAGERGSEVNYNPIEKEERLVTFDVVPQYHWGVVVAKPSHLAFIQRNRNVRQVAMVYGSMFLLTLLISFTISFILSERQRMDLLKDEFISTVSHEIRNPLFAIRESISQLQEGILGEINQEQKEFLSIALVSIDRLSRIINDLLDVARMTAGKLRLQLGWCHLAEVAKKTVASFKIQAQEKGIELRERFGPGDVVVLADDDRVSQVFANLMTNALKFTQKGFIEVALVEKKDCVECSVSDTGIGIAQEQLKNIFSKLRTFSSVTQARGKGTGLGLIISKQIIALHGGQIRMESLIGKGTTVTFTLPKYTHEEAAIRFLDSFKPPWRIGQRLSMLFYEIEGVEDLKTRFSQEEMADFLQGMGKAINANIRRIAQDTLLKGRYCFLVILPQLKPQEAEAVQKRIDKSLNDYLLTKGLTGEVKTRATLVMYPDVKRQNKDLFVKLVNLIVDTKCSM
ncbi:MAG: hypothetical protein AMJ95_10770 [Omnitrophica WOR_2 bacterium SM23_72]|nr:MAG: hypothetical protein AMJ95_10770 [Omnitrophica WOR_2 bacterium SM23_72]